MLPSIEARVSQKVLPMEDQDTLKVLATAIVKQIENSPDLAQRLTNAIIDRLKYDTDVSDKLTKTVVYSIEDSSHAWDSNDFADVLKEAIDRVSD